MASPGRAEQRRKARKIPERDVAIVTCHPDNVDGQFHDTLMQLALYDSVKRKRILVYQGLASGPRIAEARNTLVKVALEAPDMEWVWMIDADMSLQRTTLYDMLDAIELEPKVKVLGALCFSGGRTWRPKPVIYSESTPGVFKLIDNYPEQGLCKVAATGAACLLIHRSVLEEIYKLYSDRAHPWFEDGADGLNQYGEDITFCRRARQVGFDIYVHTEIEVGHMKTAPLNSALHKLLKGLNPYEAAEFEKAYEKAMGKPS